MTPADNDPKMIVVSTTCDDRSILEKIAARLVELRLAACCQIGGPINSCYRWQGKVESASEWLCTIKTSANLYERVETSIRELHNYDEPEIIAVEICNSSAGYLNWLAEQLAAQPDRPLPRSPESG